MHPHHREIGGSANTLWLSVSFASALFHVLVSVNLEKVLM